MEGGLEMKTEKTKCICMCMSRYQNAGRNRDIMTGNKSFEKVMKLKCLEAMITNENFIRK
jgi:hypothetical protein